VTSRMPRQPAPGKIARPLSQQPGQKAYLHNSSAARMVKALPWS